MQNTKAKFILTAVAVCAMFGGAMALKANKTSKIYGRQIWYAPPAAPNGPCTSLYANYTIVGEFEQGFQTHASAASNANGCPLVTVTREV